MLHRLIEDRPSVVSGNRHHRPHEKARRGGRCYSVAPGFPQAQGPWQSLLLPRNYRRKEPGPTRSSQLSTGLPQGATGPVGSRVISGCTSRIESSPTPRPHSRTSAFRGHSRPTETKGTRCVPGEWSRLRPHRVKRPLGATHLWPGAHLRKRQPARPPISRPLEREGWWGLAGARFDDRGRRAAAPERRF